MNYALKIYKIFILAVSEDNKVLLGASATRRAGSLKLAVLLFSPRLDSFCSQNDGSHFIDQLGQ